MICTSVHDFGTMEFGHGRFLGKRLAIISQPAGLVKDKTGTLDLKGHISKLKGVHLKI